MKEKFSKYNKDIDIWKMVKQNVRFYFSEPNKLHPPTAGLWKNLNTHKYEVWSHFKKNGRVTFERAGHCPDHINHYDINEWLQGVMKDALRQYDIDIIVEWLHSGKKFKKK